jgi:hypothetical protein
LERGVSPDAYRAQTRATVDQARREWKVTARRMPRRAAPCWPLTLVDARRPRRRARRRSGRTPGADRAWARSVLAAIWAAGAAIHDSGR